MIEHYTLKYYGEYALVLQLKDTIDLDQVLWLHGLEQYLLENYSDCVQETQITYCEILIKLNDNKITVEDFKHKLDQLIQEAVFPYSEQDKSIFQIPVCYSEKYALDYQRLIDHTGLSWSQIVMAHQSAEYRIFMLGFIPGFLYLGGLPSNLACPRLEKPRVKVEAGSVGIAGFQTGVYAIPSPGGWNIMGRSPVQMESFDPSYYPWFKPLDVIQFYSISEEEYESIEANLKTTEEKLQFLKHGL